MTGFEKVFSAIARWTARQMGRASAFALACVLIIVWGASGPIFHYSDTWQLVINTSTTIVTFLMVFLIQHAQNRDSTAVQLKLDELIRVNRDARNKLLALEDLSEVELEQFRTAFTKIAAVKTVAGSLDEAEDQLEDAKDGIEQARSAIVRLRK